ncbi:MAG: CbtB-domain containing protein [Actinobacteria bacterium]|nr:CbtB-domain containing protein [Actinomycetota bacterium]
MTTTEEAPVHSLAPRSLVTALPARVADQVLAAGFMVAGAAILYLVLFDQGTAAALISTSAAHQNLFHELFHDGRHLASAPCH